MIHAVATGRFFLAAMALALLAGCSGPRLPHPRYVSHPTAALAEIPYPAPPPLVESVPEQPARNAVWVDGEWRFSARKWRWTHGVWVTRPADLAFSPPVEVRGADGTLWYAPGTWRDAQGEAVDDPESLARARGGGVNSVVNASGELEEVGRTRSNANGRGGSNPPPKPVPSSGP